MSQKKISYCSIAGPCQDLTSHLVTDEYIYLSPSYLAFRYYQMYPMQTYPMYRMYQMQTDCSLPQRFLLKGRCHGSCHRSKDSVEHRFLQKTVRHPNEYFTFGSSTKFPVILVPANWEKIIPAIMLSCEFWLSSPANSNVSIVTLKSPAFISFVLLTHQQTDPAVISYNRLKE